MAQKAKKDRAKSNTAALNDLHAGALIINFAFLAWHFVISPRSLWLYGLLSIPAFICQYVLEVSGRPKYDNVTKALKSSGEDLGAKGLTEYMFDVVWVTWASAVAVILLGNKGWLLWLALPAYGLYLGSSLLGMGKQKMADLQGGGLGGDSLPQHQGNRRARRAA